MPPVLSPRFRIKAGGRWRPGVPVCSICSGEQGPACQHVASPGIGGELWARRSWYGPASAAASINGSAGSWRRHGPAFFGPLLDRRIAPGFVAQERDSDRPTANLHDQSQRRLVSYRLDDDNAKRTGADIAGRTLHDRGHEHDAGRHGGGESTSRSKVANAAAVESPARTPRHGDQRRVGSPTARRDERCDGERQPRMPAGTSGQCGASVRGGRLGAAKTYGTSRLMPMAGGRTGWTDSKGASKREQRREPATSG
jgi:hypothetical protein